MIRVLIILPVILICGYSILYVLEETKCSPTNQEMYLTDGRKVAYQYYPAVEEKAPRLVFVHGAPANASSWHKFRNKHRESLLEELIFVDRFGYGNSDPKQELSLADHAQSLTPFLSDSSARSKILIGHSYGGPVVLRTAADYPDQVNGIVLVAGATDPYMGDSKWFRRAVNRLSPIIPRSWATSNRELLALTDENKSMTDYLAEVKCPVVIVHGTWDPVCPYNGTVDYLNKELVHASLVKTITIEKGGHNLHLSHSGRILEAIRIIEKYNR